MQDERESNQLPPWNTYLYRLQQEAPKPFCVACQREVPNKPEFYGNEFHGNISRPAADSLLVSDGCYLVRKSERAPDAFTLAIRFNGETKNYKLYYDGQHFVGEKRFDTVYDLVADGLIHFYIELWAADYIKQLSSESTYEESPYMTYNQCRLRHDKTLRVRPTGTYRRQGVSPDITDSSENTDNNVNSTPEEDEPEQNMDWTQYEKPHVFKVQNFSGLNWCELCANFMWGLIAQGVKCQDCGVQTHKKCSERMPNECMPIMKYVKRLYAVDLTTVTKANKQLLPIVVEKCVKEIEKRGVDAEGLYRLAGFHDDVEAIRVSFDKDGENTDIGTGKYEDINTIAGALKLYFRLLPIPLITFEVYNPLLDLIKKDGLSEAEMVKQMKEILNHLLPAHFHTLKYLTTHLVKVMEQKNKNMMSAENLSIVFAPTLMRPLETNPAISLLSAKFEQKVIEFILNHQRDVLGR
ncbi:N-chimaerin-like isoform X2 [Babylonia areolata]|uniref:N-chimaerin-like isoform X2 n=1 Tax=Babylonia areolata TaxID=304850 RepID=UPI003FD47048